MTIPAHTKELAHLTEKLQKFTLKMHPHPTDRHGNAPIHRAMQQCADTLCTTQWQENLTISLLQDFTMFDGQATSKLEDWLGNIETAADILRESHTCLAKAKS